MKLSEVVIDKKIPTLSYARFPSDAYDMSYEAGIVTIVRKNHPEGGTWLVPAANVIYMKVDESASKKK